MKLFQKQTKDPSLTVNLSMKASGLIDNDLDFLEDNLTDRFFEEFYEKHSDNIEFNNLSYEEADSKATEYANERLENITEQDVASCIEDTFDPQEFVSDINANGILNDFKTSISLNKEN